MVWKWDRVGGGGQGEEVERWKDGRGWRGRGGWGEDFREEEESGHCQLLLVFFSSSRKVSYPVSSKFNGSLVAKMQSSLEKKTFYIACILLLHRSKIKTSLGVLWPQGARKFTKQTQSWETYCSSVKSNTLFLGCSLVSIISGSSVCGMFHFRQQPIIYISFLRFGADS